LSNEPSVKFGLRGIKTEVFDIIENNFEEGKEVGVGINLNFKVNPDKRMVSSFMEFSFTHVTQPFLKIGMSLHFEISEESWTTTAKISGNEVTISKDFLSHLAMITTGTLRGALFSKTEGTPMNRFIIPTINITELVNKDGKFEISKTNHVT